MSDKMSDVAKMAKAAYQREWNKKHPEALKRYRNNYWERKAAEMQGQEQAAKMLPDTTNNE